MKKTYLKYITSLLLFGSNGIIASRIFLSSTEIVFARTLIGGLTVLLYFVLSKRSIKLLQKSEGFRSIKLLQNREDFAFIILAGAAMGGSWIFLYKAYTLIGVGLATLACYCGPMMVMVLSPFLFHERLTWRKVSGFLSVLLGFFLANDQDYFPDSSYLGIFYGMMAAVMYTAMIIFNKKASEFDGLENPLCQLSAAFLTTALFMGLSQGISLSRLQKPAPYSNVRCREHRHWVLPVFLIHRETSRADSRCLRLFRAIISTDFLRFLSRRNTESCTARRCIPRHRRCPIRRN